MKLLTQEILKEFELQGDTSCMDAKDIRVIAKYFNPVGVGTWFAVQYYPEDRLFFGYVNLGDVNCAELGYFSLDDLESTKLPFGLGIERDIHFGKYTLQDVIDRKGVL